MTHRLFPFLVLFLLAPWLAAPAYAVTKSLTWNPVTTCVDGSACTPEKYTLYRQLNGGAFVSIGTTVPPVVTFTDPAVPVGSLCYQVTDQSVLNGESAPSNLVCLQVAPPALSAPTNLR